MELVALFYLVDEFCAVFEPEWNKKLLESGEKQRVRDGTMTLSEILTIIIYFHMSNQRTFKKYYRDYVSVYLKADFPRLVSYGRFVELESQATIPLLALLISLLGEPGLANFVDSTTLDVCDNRRIWKHRVFKGIATRGKSSMGWFFGLKLHITVNDQGQLVSFLLTPGNVPDNNRPMMVKLTEKLSGKLYGDRGYISHDLFLDLLQRGVQLVTGIRRNMKNYLMPLWDKLMLRKRSIIETINDQLKNTQQIEHSRHRSPKNFITNLLSGLIAYQLQPKKPSLHFKKTEQRLLTQTLLTN